MALDIEDAALLAVFDFLFKDEHSFTSDIVNYGSAFVSVIRRNNKPRISGYVEERLPYYTLDDFSSVFRVTRGMCEELIILIGDRMRAPHPRGGGRPAVSADKSILVSLYYLGCQETIRKIADKFGISEYSVSRARDAFLSSLLSLKNDIVKWPKGSRLKDIADGFESKQGLKRVIGAIDGSHISIRPPVEHHENYVNRKQFHSIILQAVCDHERLIIDVHAGWPGSVHDARVFRRSPIAASLEDNYNETCPGGSYLLGDAAYGLKEYLITPFKDNGRLSANERNFNYKHSSSRMVIEHTFGLLKGRWRRLKRFDIVSQQTCVEVVMSCCILHNLCVLRKEDLSDYMADVEVVNAFEVLPLFRNTPNGVTKRLQIMNEL